MRGVGWVAKVASIRGAVTFAAVGIVFRQSVKATILTFTGTLLGAAVLYFSQRFLPKQELGFVRNLLPNFSVVAAQILVLGFHGTLAVYIHRYATDESRRRALIGITLTVPLVVVLLLSGLYWLLRDQFFALFQPQDIPLMRRYAVWLPVFVFLFTLQILLDIYLMSRMKVALSTAVREVGLRLLALGLLFLFAAELISFDVLVAGTVLSYAVSNAMLLALCLRAGGLQPSFQWSVFTRAEIREMLHFTWYHALLGVSVNLLGYLDALMLAPLDSAGLEAAAVYGFAVFIISVLQVPYRAMTSATVPVLNQAFAQGDMEKVGDVFRRSSLNILVATLAVLLPILFNMPSLPAYMQPGFEAIIWLVPILAIGRLVDAATGLNDHLLSVSKHYTFSFWLSLALIGLIVFFNALLIPRIGVYGAAWGTTLALIAYNIAKYFFAWYKLGLQPFSQHTLRVLLCAVIAAVPGYFMLGLGSGVLAILVRAAVVVGAYAALLLALRASPDVQTYWAGIRKSKRLF